MIDGYIEPSDFGINVGSAAVRTQAILYFLYPTRYSPSMLTVGFSPDLHYRSAMSRDIDYSTGSQVREKYFLGSLQSIDYVTTPLAGIDGWQTEAIQESHPNTEPLHDFVIPPKATMPKYTIGVLMVQASNSTGQLLRGIHLRDIDDVEAASGFDNAVPTAMDVDKTELERNWNPYDSISAFDVKYLLIRMYNRLAISCKNSIDFPMFGRITEADEQWLGIEENPS